MKQEDKTSNNKEEATSDSEGVSLQTRLEQTPKRQLERFFRFLRDTATSASQPEFLKGKSRRSFDQDVKMLGEIEKQFWSCLDELDSKNKRRLMASSMAALAITAELLAAATERVFPSGSKICVVTRQQKRNRTMLIALMNHSEIDFANWHRTLISNCRIPMTSQTGC